MSAKAEQINSTIRMTKPENDSLPELAEPIAQTEVPALDDLESAPKPHTKKEIIKKIAKWVGISFATVSTAFGVYSAAKSFGDGNGSHEVIPPDATDSSNSNESTTITGKGDETEVIVATEATAQNTIESQQASNTSESEDTQETVMPTNWYEIDWSKQTSELQKLNNMSVEDFRNSSQDDQLLYWSFLNHIYFTQYTSGVYASTSFSGRVYSKNESASLDDSAQEIIDQDKTKIIMADASSNEDRNFDPDQARKLLSGASDNINSFINVNDNVDTVAEKYDSLFSKVPANQKLSGVITDDKAFTQVGKDRSEIKTYADGSKYVSLLMVSDSGVVMYCEYKFVTIPKNYAGQEESVWLNVVAKVQDN